MSTSDKPEPQTIIAFAITFTGSNVDLVIDKTVFADEETRSVIVDFLCNKKMLGCSPKQALELLALGTVEK